MVGLQNRDVQLVLQLGPTACLECPYGKIGWCGGPTTVESYNMEGKDVVGCLNPQKQEEFYRALVDLYIPEQEANQENLILPTYIPLITNAIPSVPRFNSNPIYAISMATLLNDRGDLCFESSQELRQKLGLLPDSRVALVGQVKDKKLERFWTLSEEQEVWRRIANLNFEFVTSCTFSVWYDHPRFDQIYNQERNFLTHDFIASFGIPSIPFLMFSNEKLDYQENISWLRGRPDISIVALRGQHRPKSGDFRDLLDEMRAISEDVKRPIHFLISGCSEPNRIASILNGYDATIVDGHAFMAGINGERILQNLGEAQDLEPSKEELTLNNMQLYDQYCEKIHCVKNSLLFSL